MAKVRDSLTPEQEEILSLIARGHTNGQIAEHLGISLEGAKRHVSEIIAKLGVESREEAVQAWRSQEPAGRRFARGLRVLLAPIAVHKRITGTVAVAVVAAVTAGGLFLATRGGPTEHARELPHSSTFGQVVATPRFFNRLQMMDSAVGWAQFQSNEEGLPSQIIRTEDGAQTWRNVSPALPGGETIHQAFFLDTAHAWVLIDDVTAASPPLLPTRISRVAWTADAGKTWTESAPVGISTPVPPLGSDLLMITFADSQHGWVRDNAGTLFRTTDSGNTWHRISVSSGTNSQPVTGHLPASCSAGLTFRDSSQGYAAGTCPNDSSGLPLFFRSENAGASWTRQSLPLPGNAQQSVGGCQCVVSLPSFPTPSDGFVALWSPIPMGASHSAATSWQRTVYASHDGGRTWQVIGAPHTGDAYLGMVRFVDAMHGWLVDSTQDSARSFRTVDGGLTWQQLPGDQFLAPLNFTSPTEAWALSVPRDASGPWGVIHSVDGGETWQPVVPGQTDPRAPAFSTPPPGK
jgi:DNA-binding CsgD family transcriptional regulator/photosystem II stability/assembly factor-like uncharacterized protein